MTTNNTFKHISPDAKYVDFDPAGTSFPANVLNVQDALALTSPTQYATTTTAGVITIATQAEVLAGTDTKKVVTPATLAARLAYPQSTTSQLGVIRLATDAEAQAGTNTEKAIVPSSLKYTIEWYFTNRTALEGRLGVLKLSTTAAATAGVDDTTAMTPLKVKQAIANATAQIPSYTSASESVSGLVRLATLGQAQQGTLRDGYAISPYTLMNLTGNNSRKGVVQAASQAQVNAGTDESLYVSAKGFKTYIATSTNIGTVKLTDTLSSTFSAGVALSSNAKVLSLAGGTLTGDLTVNTNLDVKGAISVNSVPIVSRQELDDYVPIGTIIEWNEQNLPNSKWSWYSSGSTTSRVLIAKTVKYTGGWMTIPLASVLQSNESFLNADLFTLIVNPEQPHEAWSIHRDVKEFRIQVFNRSGTNRIGYNGVISFVIYKNQASSSNKIIRVQ